MTPDQTLIPDTLLNYKVRKKAKSAARKTEKNEVVTWH